MKEKEITDKEIELPRLIPGQTVIKFHAYQVPVFKDHKTGVVVLHWARQVGKSFTLAAWAVDRLLRCPGRLVTVLSNSRENGAEFMRKCNEVCALMHEVIRDAKATVRQLDLSKDVSSTNLRLELHMRVPTDKEGVKTSRIKVLAANPRTARGFSGDLILDEFAFHEDSRAIWEAAEPILASNKDFLCRIASTGNGKHNLFYHFAARARGHDSFEAKLPEGIAMEFSRSGHLLSRVPRSLACTWGQKVHDPQTREEITPADARARALDKRAYDQNYECAFADECLTLLSYELITAAEREDVGVICEQEWSAAALAMLREAKGPLYAGFDVARKGDLSVISVMEEFNGTLFVRAILRMQDLRLPEQQLRLGEICRQPRFQRAAIDMTGLGLGLLEFAQEEFGASKIRGINFASTVPATKAVQSEGRKRETVRVTEAMAMELLQAYEERRIQHPADDRLREDLRKPEKITTPGGRVSIAATRDEAGHADHFWSFALALEARGAGTAPFAYRTIAPRRIGKYLL
jgi:phage FluMu gp28-like protein